MIGCPFLFANDFDEGPVRMKMFLQHKLACTSVIYMYDYLRHCSPDISLTELPYQLV